MEPLLVSLFAATEAAPSDVPLRLHLAELLLAREDEVEALRQCATALAVDPLHQEARALMGRLLDRSTGGSASESAADGDRPVPDSAPAPVPPGASQDDLDTDAASGAEIPSVAALSGAPTRRGGFSDDYPWAERVNVTLADIGGMDIAKERLEAAVLAPMRNPELRRLYRKSRSGGVLLYGPPGCGKTFLARATAGELAARFLSVSFEGMTEQEQAQEVAAVFQAAREQAPVVLCLRTVEELGATTYGRRGPSGRGVAALVAELDKGPEGNPGVTVMGTSNAPWAVDPSIQRSGRLEQKLLVLPPDRVAREVVLRQHAQEHPDVDTAEIARLSGGFSAADLADAIREVEGTASPVTTQDVLDALLNRPPSSREWLQEARREMTAIADPGSFVGLREYIAMADRRPS